MRVGTSFRCNGFQIINQDHPHACGDKYNPHMRAEVTRGSSPCVWGQARYHPSPITLLRIIPMRVGTRPFALSDCPCLWDHPHACGDKVTE